MNKKKLSIRGFLHMTRHGSYLASSKEFSRECAIPLLTSSSNVPDLKYHPEAEGVTFETSKSVDEFYKSQQLYRFDLVRNALPVIATGILIVKKTHQLPFGIKAGNGFGPQGKYRLALLVEEIELIGKSDQ